MGKKCLSFFVLNTAICYHLSQKIPMPQIARSLEDIAYLEEKCHCMLPLFLSSAFAVGQCGWGVIDLLSEYGYLRVWIDFLERP